MKRKRALLDCDGVLANFHSPTLSIVKSLTGIDYSKREVREWNLFDSFGINGDVVKMVYDKIREPGWCSSLHPFPFAQDAVERLKEKYDVYVVTSPMRPHKTWCSEREDWLYHYFSIPAKRVIHTSEKHLIHGDFLIDDKDEHLVDWQDEHEDGIAIKWIQSEYHINSFAGPSFADWNSLITHLEERL